MSFCKSIRYKSTRQLMKYIFSLLFVIISTNVFAQEIAENKIITISGMPSNAPYCYTDSKGKLGGYIPNVVKVIMEDAGLSYQFVPNKQEPMYHYNSIAEEDEFINVADLYMTEVISNKKRAVFYYSIPYLTIEFYILSKKGNSYRGVSDFVGKSFGVTKNHSSEARVLVAKEDNGRLISDTIITFPTLSQGLESVAKGEVDYLQVSEQCLITHKDEIKELELEVNYSNYPALDVAIASKDKELIAKINKSITRLRGKGTLEYLFAKYVLGNSYLRLEIYFYWIIAIGIVVILLLLFVIHICRRIIRHKVKAIKEIDGKLSHALKVAGSYIWEYTYGSDAISVISGGTENMDIDFSAPDKQFENVHPEDREIIRTAMVDLHSSKIKKVDVIIRLRDTKGNFHWMRDIIDKIPTKDGYQLIGSCQNVDDKVKLQMKMEEERKSFMFIADSAPMGIFIKDSETQKILYHNQAALNVFEVKDADKVDNFWNYIHSENTLETVKQSDKMVFEKEGDVSYGLNITFLSGKEKFLYVIKRVITFEDKPRLLVMVFDYSEQVKLEMSKQMIDLSKPLIKAYTWSYDVQSHTYTYGSGYDTEDRHISRVLKKELEMETFMHPEDWVNYSQEIYRLAEVRDGDSHIKFRTNVEDGKDFVWWESYMRSETKTQNGQAYTVIYGCNLNIDKQMRNEIELKRAKEKAEESERMKSMFLSNMSHEIRTPLNAIVGFSSLLSEAEGTERDEFASIIRMNSEILINLINDILDLSKIEAGLALNIESLNFAQFFNDISSSLMYKHNNPDVEFIVENPYDTIICNIDKNRIGQVITNFTTNAIKHTTKGHIKVGYTYCDEGLELYVEDSGRGIPADKQHLVFQRFQKLDTITQGTGLGLSIVAAIVHKMDGEYGFESQEGVGSRFWARIKPDITDLGQLKESEQSISYRTIERDENTTDSKKLNILVVEDVLSNFVLIEKILKAYNLTHVKNGKEAVEHVKQGGFDFILMDMRMPIMGGIEATKEIRKFNKHIPIIAITADAFDADRVAALEAGCNGFHSKPLNKKELLKDIERLAENAIGGGNSLKIRRL